jgi:hypothetical protein
MDVPDVDLLLGRNSESDLQSSFVNERIGKTGDREGPELGSFDWITRQREQTVLRQKAAFPPGCRTPPAARLAVAVLGENCITLVRPHLLQQHNIRPKFPEPVRDPRVAGP